MRDGLAAYCTYPHVDMAATGARAAQLLERTIAARPADGEGDAPARFPDRPAVAVHVHRARARASTNCWRGSSANTMYRCRSRRASRWRTFPNAGWRCSATGADAARVQRAVDALAHAVHDAEPDFAMELFEPDDAVARAMQRGETGAPVVLADTQDNPGAGGNGDTTGLLAALLKRDRARRRAGSADRPRVGGAGARRGHRPHAAYSGSGEISGVPGHVPLAGEFKVEDARRRQIHVHRTDVQGLPDGTGADGRPAPGQRARRARVEEVPGRRPGNVPPRRHRAAAAARAGAEELRAFPRRLPADREGSAGGRRAGTGEGRSDDVPLDAAAARVCASSLAAPPFTPERTSCRAATSSR